VGHALRDASSDALAHRKPKVESLSPTSINRNATQVPPSLLSASLFEDHTIGVDFAVDLDLLLLMP
jgi:hypothetical protein